MRVADRIASSRWCLSFHPTHGDGKATLPLQLTGATIRSFSQVWDAPYSLLFTRRGETLDQTAMMISTRFCSAASYRWLSRWAVSLSIPAQTSMLPSLQKTVLRTSATLASEQDRPTTTGTEDDDLDNLCRKHMDLPAQEFAMGCSLLHKIALGVDASQLEQLLQDRPSLVNFRDYDRRSPLHVAPRKATLIYVAFSLQRVP